MTSDFQANSVRINECNTECRKQIDFLKDQVIVHSRYIHHLRGKVERKEERINKLEGLKIQNEAIIVSQSEEIARLRRKLTKLKKKKKFWRRILHYLTFSKG